MEQRRGAHRRNLARRASRPGSRPDAVRIRHRRSCGRNRRTYRVPAPGLARGFLCGCASRFAGFLDLSWVPEPELWKNRSRGKESGGLRQLFQKDVYRNGLLATAMNACGMFGYWGLFTWIPGYLSLPVSQGGRGLTLVAATTLYLVLSPGKWLGYASFG